MRKIYLHFLQEMEKELQTIDYDTQKVRDLQQYIESKELLLPVIGQFSSGKSTLLNSFIGRDILPVGITPETALASELRYASDERIEAIKKDGGITTFSIDEIEKIKERAKDFSYLTFFINSNVVRDIAPLILVDMPGFSAANEFHQQAIMEYLNKGVHYVCLISVEEGTIQKSMEIQLRDVKEFERKFSVFLSKCNLRSPEESKEIATKIQEQLEDNFDEHISVVPIDDNGGESLGTVMQEIHISDLEKQVFFSGVEALYRDILGSINTEIASLTKSKEQNDDAITALKESVAKIEQKRDQLMNDARNTYTEQHARQIIEAVGSDLSSSVEQFVSIAMSGNSDEMSRQISEVARSSLISKMKEVMTTISSSIIDTFQLNIQDIETNVSGYTPDASLLENIADTVKGKMSGIQQSMTDMVAERQKKKGASGIYMAITGILALSTGVIAPVLEAIIVFLPSLLSGLFKKSREEKQREQIRSTLLTQTFPSIKREIATKVESLLEEQTKTLIQGIGTQYQELLEQKSKEIEKAEEEKNKKIQDIEQIIATKKECVAHITSLANEKLYG